VMIDLLGSAAERSGLTLAENQQRGCDNQQATVLP